MLTWETLRLSKKYSEEKYTHHDYMQYDYDSNLKGLGVHLNCFNIHPSIVELEIFNRINLVVPFLTNKTPDCIAQLVPIINLLQLVMQTLHRWSRVGGFSATKMNDLKQTVQRVSFNLLTVFFKVMQIFPDGFEKFSLKASVSFVECCMEYVTGIAEGHVQTNSETVDVVRFFREHVKFFMSFWRNKKRSERNSTLFSINGLPI